MKTIIVRPLRLAAVAAAMLLLSTCEFLFYSPAFMPAVSETRVETDGALWVEYFNGDRTGDWSYTWAAPTLTGGGNATTGWTIPAMDILSFADQGWHGVNEFMAMLVPGGGLDFGTLTPGAAIGGSFHGAYPITYDYNMSAPASYELPFSAPRGIGEDGRTTKLTGGLTVVDYVIYGSTEDVLNGEATLVFSGSGPYGLLYLVYYHDTGDITVAYQTEGNPSGPLDAFPTGDFTYVINVFRR